MFEQNIYLCVPERSAATPFSKPRLSSAKSKDPEDFSSIHTASGSSHNTSRALPQDPSSWFSYAQPFLKHYASL